MELKRNPDLIVKTKEEARKHLKCKTGIYAIYAGKTICLYVGTSINLASRIVCLFNPNQNLKGVLHQKLLGILLNHFLANQPDIIGIKIYFHRKENLIKLEQQYIKKLHARLNCPDRLYKYPPIYSRRKQSQPDNKGGEIE